MRIQRRDAGEVPRARSPWRGFGGRAPIRTAGATKSAITKTEKNHQAEAQHNPRGAHRIADLIARNSVAYFVQRKAVRERQKLSFSS